MNPPDPARAFELICWLYQYGCAQTANALIALYAERVEQPTNRSGGMTTRRLRSELLLSELIDALTAEVTRIEEGDPK